MRVVALLIVTTLGGCGRVGIELLQLREDSLDGGPAGVEDPADDGSSGPQQPDSGEPAALVDAALEPDSGCPLGCANLHGSASCVLGTCQASCSTGYASCDGETVNGCESSTSSSIDSCGGCQVGCSNAHGSTSCSDGLCLPTCAAGFGDCDLDPKNGCERDVTSVTSCGACDSACSNAHGTTACSGSTCVPSCAANYGDCDGDSKNGCETNLASDPVHCGMCTKACGSNGQVCVAGSCQASTCAAGFAECDGDLSKTCETDTRTTLGSCGFCNNVCSTPNATPRCAASSCQIASCNAGYADCDASPSSGCEVALASTTAHCGSCGNACSNAHGTTSCRASACVPSCSTGYDDCDGQRPNGCETALNSVSNCGRCGAVCPANGGTPVCTAGVCDTVCNLTGTYALKLTVAVSWSATSYVSSGSGTVTVYSRLQGTQSGNSLSGSVVECARVTPDLRSSVLSESYNVSYPNAIYDHAPTYLQAGTASVTLSGTSPGASFTLARTAQLMGASMADPVNGVWPSSASGLSQIDTDQDGKPGVSAAYANDSGRTYPPTAPLFGAARTDGPYVAARIAFSLSGTLSSCTQSSGSASVTAVDTAIFGCSMSSGGDCNASQSSFLDNNQMTYRPGSATYTLVKVAAGASCAAVRAAL